MPITEILAGQSRWTWDTFDASTELGEVIREDALTSVNLAMIYSAVRSQGIPLQITSMQGAHLEKLSGADWFWIYNGAAAQLIQAKKLDFVKAEALVGYTIDVAQLDTLIGYAAKLETQRGIDVIPYYVLFNSRLPGKNATDFGCTACPALTIREWIVDQGKIGQKSVFIRFADLEARMVPWYTLLP